MKKLFQKLKNKGYKLTKPREKVLELLAHNHKALSAQEIHQFIGDVDKVSVYRTLHLLEHLDIVTIENWNNEKLYCLATHPHHHIICKKCGYSEEVACTHTYRFTNFNNVQHQLTLTGVCNKCNI